jgi:hypothetical protein
MTMLDTESVTSFAGSIFGGRKRDPETESVITRTSGRKAQLIKKGPAGSDKTESSTEGDDSVVGPSEFVIECKNGEMVFVTAAQGKVVQSRCRYFRDLLAAGAKAGEGSVMKNPNWSVSTVRRLIELLTTGSTWIDNDASCFAELSEVAEEAVVELRLASLINYYDVLDRQSTRQFFKMIDINKYQFKIRATVKSCQWMELMKRGILLLLKSKVIMVKTGPKVIPKSQKKVSPTTERLTKCDSICSEFCVYANGNVNAVLTIMDTLSPVTTTEEKMARQAQPEEFKLVFKTRVDSMSNDDLEMMWRITATTYRISTEEEQGYLKPNRAATGRQSSTPIEAPSLKKNTTMPAKNARGKYAVSSSALVPVAESNKTPQPQPTKPSTPKPAKYQCRTLNCTSFLVLKHLFDSVDSDEKGGCRACLIVTAPTPDTLGRLVNATRTSQDHELGFDLERNVFFASKAVSEMKQMLEYLADYSSSAVVLGDFKLTELEKRE